MNREFLPYDKALKLKELGFEERCFTRYYESGKLADSLSYLHHNYFGQVNAPTFSQAFRWFRENYRLSVLIQDWLDDYSGEIVEWTIGEDRIIYEITNRTDTYEEAELACLDKLIELVESELK